MKTHRTHALLGLLFLTVFDSAECLVTEVRPDGGVSVTVSAKPHLDQCEVCPVVGANATQTLCGPSVTVAPEEEVGLEFRCSEPLEQAFDVDVVQAVVCTADACSPPTGRAPQSILPQFSRTFTWRLEAPEQTAVRLQIQGGGLGETTQPCADGRQYSVSSADGETTRYCGGGSVTRLDVLGGGTVALRVQPGVGAEPVFLAAPFTGRTVGVRVGSDMEVVISPNPAEPECEVCWDGPVRTCSRTEATLSVGGEVSLDFSCTDPQDLFTVGVKRTIACTQTSCSPASGDADPDLLKDFRRRLTWAVASPGRTVVTLDFPDPGLQEVSGAETCPDGLRFSVSSGRSDQKVTKSFCRGGSVSTLDLSGGVAVTVEVPQGGELGPTAFRVQAAPRASRMISVTTDPDTKVTLKREDDGSDCQACVNAGPDQTCDQKQVLRDPRNVSVEFTCPQPQDVFTVEINRDLDCSKVSCSADLLPSEYSLFPDFNRSFSWDFKVGSTQAFQLDFPEPGLRQVPNEQTCPDDLTFSVVSYLRSGPTDVGTFCRGGPVGGILVRYKGRVILKAPGRTEVEPVAFPFSEGPPIEPLAVLTVLLPRGLSDTRLLTPNYPQGFPDGEAVQWAFVVPGMHNYSLLFNQHVAPECLQRDVVVEYSKGGAGRVTQRGLGDPQPAHQQGNFNMTLKNCRTNTSLQGLGLDFNVSVMRSGHPVLCTVDLPRHPPVAVQIEKVGSDPYCEMSVDSKVEQKVSMAAGSSTRLAFLDCPHEDLRLTARQDIECGDVSSCPGTLLTVPSLPSCLSMPLHSFTWRLTFPQDATADLVSPTGSLRQSLPGQRCARAGSLHVAEADGFDVGDFCFNGAIQKVQVHTNVSITARSPGLSRTRGHFLNISFSPEIAETVIYRVTPDVSSPTLLATPNWPRGMKQSSTVSWIVTVPSRYRAHLQFNVSQPKCKDQHTAIKVKVLGSEEEMLSRGEEEQPPDQLLVPHSFYLNMSNCIPEDRDFSAVTRIELQKKSSLLAVLLGVAGALLLLILVLVVVCVVTKRKKRAQMTTESSIYMGKGNIFRPNDRTFSKARSDNESHVYASIDDMMVYGHLLGDSAYTDGAQDRYNGLQVDSYNTFTGPADGALPVIKEPDPDPETDQYRSFLDPAETFIPSRPRTPIDRQDSLGFQDRRMVDNELYTFKTTGDINTIRLSGADMEPQPPDAEDAL